MSRVMMSERLVRLVSSKPDSAARKEAAFAALFEHFWVRVRRHVEAFVDDGDEVDELVSDVFGLAWEKLKPDRPMGLPWLLRTADNKVRDRDRRARSRSRAIDALVQGAAVQPGSLDDLDKVAVRDAVASLSGHERRVVILTYWDELSAGEIAETLRCSPGSVWTTLSRARGKLRDQLGLTADGGEDDE
ncbi:sigma-70 family RNA polymerase sigma factor [Microbacterium sp. LWS13-1.2]|uniref:Sigma-70 family RNA polymerase sigma factor n=1 Tax=Microbacterium sp. LWS13-1.2 TaxID=3135264 RepID=A0AAU6S6R5_9MICO